MYTLIMSVNGYEYQSEVFKIIGLSLMTPIGRLVLNVLENGFGNMNNFYIDLTGSVISFLLSLWFIQRGYERADERGE